MRGKPMIPSPRRCLPGTLVRLYGAVFFCLVFAACGISGQAPVPAWERTRGPWGGTILSLAVDGQALYAGTAMDGVYASMDGGMEWTALPKGLPPTAVNGLALRDDGVVAACNEGVWHYRKATGAWSPLGGELGDAMAFSVVVQGNSLVIGTDRGIYRAVPWKDGWLVTAQAIPGRSVGVLASGAGCLWAGTGDGALFASRDQGRTWAAPGGWPGSSGVLSLVCRGGMVMAGTRGNGILESEDSGHTWGPAKGWSGPKEAYALAWQGEVLCAGTPLGVWMRAGDGEWRQYAPGMPEPFVRALAVRDGALIAGTDGGGVLVRTQANSPWEPRSRGIAATNVTCFARDGDGVLAGTMGAGIFRRVPGDAEWVSDSAGLGNLQVLALGGEGSAWYAGTSGAGVFRRDGQGKMWKAPERGPGDPVVLSLAAKGDRAWAGTLEGRVWWSRDRGLTWDAATAGLPGEPVGCLAILGDSLFAGTFGAGVFRSRDGGSTWESVGNGLPAGPVFSLSADCDGVLAALSGYGIYRYRESGGPWVPVAVGPGGSNVLSVSSGEGTWLAGCTGGPVLGGGGTESPVPALPSPGEAWAVLAGRADAWAGTAGQGAWHLVLSRGSSSPAVP